MACRRLVLSLAAVLAPATLHAAATDVLIVPVASRSGVCDTTYSEYDPAPVMSPDGTIVVIGNGSSCAGLPTRVSSDGGATFGSRHAITVGATALAGIAATASVSGTGIIDIHTRDGMLHRSTDAGTSFGPALPGFGGEWTADGRNRPSMATSELGVVAISWLLNRAPATGISTDGGVSWRSPSPQIGGDVLWLDRDRLLLCAGKTIDGSPACWRSNDRGATFAPITGAQEPDSVTGFHTLAKGRSDDEVFWFANPAAWPPEPNLFRSTNGGDSWLATPAPAPTSSGFVRSLSATPGGSQVWITTSERQLFRSVDGATWVGVSPPTDNFGIHAKSFEVAAFSDGAIAVTGAPYGMTWRSTDSGSSFGSPSSPDGFFGLPIDHVALVRTVSNQLVALWSDAGDASAPIHAAMSGDDGLSWSSPTLVTDRPRELRDGFSAVASDDGGVFVLWPTPAGLRASVWSDGVGWERSVEVAPWTQHAYAWDRSYARSYTTSYHVAKDAAGRLLAVRTSHAETVRSLDGGRSWSSPPIPIAYSAVRSGGPAVVGDTVVVPIETSFGWQAIARTADAGLAWDFSINSFWEIPRLFADSSRLIATWRKRFTLHYWGDFTDLSLDAGESWSAIKPILPNSGVIAADAAGNLYHEVYDSGVSGLALRLRDGTAARFAGFAISRSTEYSALALSALRLGVLYAANDPEAGVSGLHFVTLDAGGITLWRGTTPTTMGPVLIGAEPGLEDRGAGFTPWQTGLTVYALRGAPPWTRLSAVRSPNGARLTW